MEQPLHHTLTVGKVQDDQASDHRVELPIELQRREIAFHKADVVAAEAAHPLVCAGDRLSGALDANDTARRPREPRRHDADVAGAGAEVENVHAGCEPRAPEEILCERREQIRLRLQTLVLTVGMSEEIVVAAHTPLLNSETSFATCSSVSALLPSVVMT